MMDTMKNEERSRYKSVVREVMLTDTSGNTLPLMKRIVFVQECMTLKCPACLATVDPTPDGCSAVMCLNCGAHYCNVCFECFNTGQADTDRSAAHTHAAKHATHVAQNRRSAFLPNDIVEKGQRDLMGKIVKKALVDLALPSGKLREGDERRPVADILHDIDIIIIIVETELNDLGINVAQLRKDVGVEIRMKLRTAAKGLAALGTAGYSPPKRKRGTSRELQSSSNDAEGDAHVADAASVLDMPPTGRKTRSGAVTGGNEAAPTPATSSGAARTVGGEERRGRKGDELTRVQNSEDNKSKRKKEGEGTGSGKLTTQGRGASSSSGQGHEDSMSMEVENSSDMPAEKGTEIVKKGGALEASGKNSYMA